MSTEKSRLYLASLIEESEDEYATIKAIWDATPRNNEKYPHEQIDATRLILAENLAPLSQSQVSICIAWFQGKTYPDGKKIRTKTIFTILTKLNLVN